MTGDIISKIPISLSTIAWVIFGVAIAIWVGVSIVLLYHWRTYGMKNRIIVLAESVYLIVSFIIVGLSVVSIFFI